MMKSSKNFLQKKLRVSVQQLNDDEAQKRELYGVQPAVSFFYVSDGQNGIPGCSFACLKLLI